MLTCPYCSESIPDGTRFCPHCRTDLAGPPPSQGRSIGTGTVLLIVGGVLLAVLVVCGGVMAALLLPAVQAARQAAMRSNSGGNLKYIGIAVHNYHDTYGSFPVMEGFREEHAAEHSWQTHLLPFIEEGPLYDRIDFDRSWDDPANSGAFRTPIRVFYNPAVEEKEDARGNALSHYAGNSRLFPRGGSLNFGEVTDGLSNTIMAGEVTDSPQPWGDPANLRDPAQGLNAGPDTFGGPWRGEGVQFLAADGAVYYLDRATPREVLEALATPDDGELIAFP